MVVGAAARDGDNVIDFESAFRSFARSASAALFGPKGGDIVRRVEAAILGFARAAVLRVHSHIAPPVFAIGFAPRAVGGALSRPVLVRPALNFGAVAGRVFGAPAASAGGHVTGVALVPSLRLIERALHALASRYEPLVMAVNTGLAGRVMQQPDAARGNAVGVFRRLGLATQCGEAGAGHAAIVGDVSLGDVAVLARNAGEIVRLSGGDGGVSLWASLRHMLNPRVTYVDGNTTLVKGQL